MSTTTNTPTHYRESDGHTYYQNENGDVLCAPTMNDDSVDFDSALFVVDVLEYLDAPEVARTMQWVYKTFGCDVYWWLNSHPAFTLHKAAIAKAEEGI